MIMEDGARSKNGHDCWRGRQISRAYLLSMGGMCLVFLWMLIITPFTTKKPFIPDDITDPRMRMEVFEWDLGMYGFYILFFVAFMWGIQTALLNGVPPDWIIFFFILWVGGALIMSSPWVRDRIDRYYKENTLEDTE